MPETPDPDIIPVNWPIRPEVHAIRVVIHSVDDIGLPFDRRGLELAPPRNPAEWDEFSRKVGDSVQKTILYIMKEERNG